MQKLVYIVLCAVLFITACAPTPDETPTIPPTEPPPTATPTPRPTSTPTPDPIVVQVDLGRTPTTLDPGRALLLDAAANDIIENTFIGLTRFDPTTGSVMPWFAEEWETTDGGLRWVLYLRDDVFWVRVTDAGEVEQLRRVTSGDVVTAIRRACEAPADQPGLQAVLFIEGCETLNSLPDASITDELVEQELGARVLNDVVLELNLTERADFLPNLLAMPVFRPVPSDMLGEGWATPENIVTSGPYAVQPQDEGLLLITNPYWPIEREGNLDAVAITFGGDASGEGVLLSQPAVALIGLNYDTFPFSKVGVRQAFNLAVDREALVNEVLAAQGQAGVPVGSVVPPGMVDTPDIEAPAQNLTLAREKLAEAGHAECILIPNTTLLTDQSEFSGLLAEALIAQWQEAFDCPANLLRVEQVPPAELLIAQRDPVVRQFQPDRAAMVLLYWQGDYADPLHYFADILGCVEIFPGAYLDAARECTDTDEAILDLYEGGARAATVADISEAFFSAEGETPAIPLYAYGRVVALDAAIRVPEGQAGPLQFDRWVRP